MKYPKEWPGVWCSECQVAVEMTEPRLIRFVHGKRGYNGEDCVEARGWDPDTGCRHDANEPIALTPAADAMLAVARGTR